MLYKLCSAQILTPDDDSAVAYGVVVIENETIIYKNPDISFNPQEMLHHIELWNELQPSFTHLKDLIEDIING